MTLRIDSHHHLWHYTPEEFDWIADDQQELRRDFQARELVAELTTACIDGTVVVQARQTLQETAWLLETAHHTPQILGVVGWLPLAAPGYLEDYQHLVRNPKLKGIRHVVQGEPDGFLATREFNDGIAWLKETGLVYDLLILHRQLDQAIEFVDRHPTQPFVLDHIAKPRIAAGEVEPWARQLRELGRRENVACKISGMVTEADPHCWSAAQLQPYFEVALEAFGANRLMIGTDWPVLTVGCTYAQWWATVENWIAPLSSAERAAILGRSAQRIYNLGSGLEAKAIQRHQP